MSDERDPVDYRILICPVCQEQVSEDRDYGAACYHEDYGYVEPVEIPVVAVNARIVAAAVAAVRPSLRDQREAASERKRKQAEWDALPQGEKDRIKAERWEKMTPEQKAMQTMVEAMRKDFSRQAFGGFTTIPARKS